MSLRYFNIYGPRQRPDSAYAAVIPLFIEALTDGRRPTVYGDGGHSRDFTFIDDAVAANIAAATAPASACSGKASNVAGGRRYSLLDLLAFLGTIQGVVADPEFTDPRPGDVRHSEADISAAVGELGYQPAVDFETGLGRTVEWFRDRVAS